MKIEHLAIWTENLETVRDFYIKYFGMRCGELYINPKTGFNSYFLSFNDSSARIELMKKPGIIYHQQAKGLGNGLAHFAISVGSKDSVDSITERLRADNYVIHGEPRTTGDGYYESVVLDPEGNLVEITI